MEIIYASSEEQIAEARTLFLEYAAGLGFDLGFQGFEEELKVLPGKYAPPEGRLLLALQDGKTAGVVALRSMEEEGVCEMKRLYVRPEYRGQGAGRALGEAIIREAREIGYREMRLDTIDWMTEARTLYRALGFVEIDPYRYNPIEGAQYFSLALR